VKHKGLRKKVIDPGTKSYIKDQRELESKIKGGNNMNLNKYTQKAQEAVMDAQKIAIEYGHQSLDIPHLHLALVKQDHGLIHKLLSRMGISVDTIIKEIEAQLQTLPRVYGTNQNNLYMSRQLSDALVKAE
jgi:ATP-dependent Clp protease ATP-binding subunit ClpB